MSELGISQIGIDHRRDVGFAVARPEGLGTWSWVHARAPMQVMTPDGRRNCSPGDCILLDPRFPHLQRSLRGGLHTDWLIFAGRGLDAAVARYELPVNQVVTLHTRRGIDGLLHAIAEERQRRPPWWRRRIAQLVDELLLRLGRATRPPDSDDRPDMLGAVREAVHQRLAEHWTLAEMAGRAGLRPSRFGEAYRTRFGLSPMEDLIQARIRQACVLLAIEHQAVGEVAAAVGFGDPAWFSRCFKQRMGCAPRTFAQRPHF